MGIKQVRRREYRGQEIDGNVFDWLVEECERIRYWGGRETRDPIPPRSTFRSLRSSNPHHASRVLLQANEPGLKTSGENTFEIAKARKL